MHVACLRCLLVVQINVEYAQEHAGIQLCCSTWEIKVWVQVTTAGGKIRLQLYS
jgi:hypothetical protein